MSFVLPPIRVRKNSFVPSDEISNCQGYVALAFKLVSVIVVSEPAVDKSCAVDRGFLRIL